MVSPRIISKLSLITLFTLPMMAAQAIALRTGWWSDRALPQLWHKAALKVLGIKVKVVGGVTHGRPLLLVSNHVSWTDILILGSIEGVHFISKAEVRNWPVMGQFAKMQRCVFIERERKGTTSYQAQQIADRLASGDPMVLFAEGTTGDGNRLLTFKSSLFGAARLALEAGDSDEVSVQPLAIGYKSSHGLLLDRRERADLAWIGSTDFVPHLMKVMKKGHIDVEVHFGEAVIFTSKSDRKEIARNMESDVKELLAKALRK